MLQELSYAQWQEYEREGFLRLGRCLIDDELAAMQQRMDDIMLGTAPVDYDRMMMQLDRIPGKTDEPGPGTKGKGYKGATLFYRKIQDLEFDPLLLRYMQKPLFRHICCMVYGADTSVACMRAMFMNKPAGEGTHLVWHQDRWTNFDRDPLITIWTSARPGHRRQRLRLHRPPPPSRPDQPDAQLWLYDRRTSPDAGGGSGDDSA